MPFNTDFTRRGFQTGTWPATKPHVVWEAPGLSYLDGFYSPGAPVFVNGTNVLTLTGKYNPYSDGSTTGCKITCYARATGAQLWQVDAPAAANTDSKRNAWIIGTHGTKVLVTRIGGNNGGSGPDSQIRALNIADGTTAWSSTDVATNGNEFSQPGVMASNGDYIGLNGFTPPLYLHRILLADGSRVWRSPLNTGALAGLRGFTTYSQVCLSPDETIVYFCYAGTTASGGGGRVAAFNAATGALLAVSPAPAFVNPSTLGWYQTKMSSYTGGVYVNAVQWQQGPEYYIAKYKYDPPNLSIESAWICKEAPPYGIPMEHAQMYGTASGATFFHGNIRQSTASGVSGSLLSINGDTDLFALDSSGNIFRTLHVGLTPFSMVCGYFLSEDSSGGLLYMARWTATSSPYGGGMTRKLVRYNSSGSMLWTFDEPGYSSIGSPALDGSEIFLNTDGQTRMLSTTAAAKYTPPDDVA